MIKASVKLKDNDAPMRALEKQLKVLKEANVTIGIHEDAGQYSSGVDVVQVGLWNEFGTDHIPERSFFRSAIDDNISTINTWRDEMVKNIIYNGWEVEKALTALGFRVQVLIQNKIKSNVPPPNAPSTVAQKRREGVPQYTLQETGLMLRSITFKVHLS